MRLSRLDVHAIVKRHFKDRPINVDALKATKERTLRKKQRRDLLAERRATQK